MGLLDQLMGGGEDRDRYGDFARRYDEGHPAEGYDDDEVAGHYGQLDRELDDDTYRSSARDSFDRTAPEERSEFGRLLRGAARERGHGDLDESYDRYGEDPDGLADYTREVRRRDPNLLSSLLGGGSGGGLGGGPGGGLGGGAGGGLAPPRSAGCWAREVVPAGWAACSAVAGAAVAGAAAATRSRARDSPASPRWPPAS